jgi:phage shock protein PspC (stress-responsive transcriptional regulator)
MYTDSNSRLKKTCFRHIKNKKLGGVCAGLAERFDLPRWVTRGLALVLFLKFPLLTLIAYGVAYYTLPTK